MAHLVAPQLRDRGVEIGCGDMCPDLVKHGKLAFKRGENGRHAGVARCGRGEVFHNQIPFKREPCRRIPHVLCVAAVMGRLSR